MMRSFFAAIFLLSFGAFSCVETKQQQVAGVSTTTTTSGTRSAKAAMEEDVLTLINKYRTTKGLPEFIMNGVVTEVARQHSADMAAGRVPFSHEGFATRSKTITTRVPGTMGVAENVAFGQRSAQEVVNDWIKSPGHKKNIEANYKQTGIGIVADAQGVLYYTQMFIR